MDAAAACKPSACRHECMLQSGYAFPALGTTSQGDIICEGLVTHVSREQQLGTNRMGVPCCALLHRASTS